MGDDQSGGEMLTSSLNVEMGPACKLVFMTMTAFTCEIKYMNIRTFLLMHFCAKAKAATHCSGLVITHFHERTQNLPRHIHTYPYALTHTHMLAHIHAYTH